MGEGVGIMQKLNLKPLSINEAFQGRRFKTDKYKAYETQVLFMLKPITIPDGPLTIEFEFGFSNMASDVDNPVKLFLDILQKKYKFNDSRVHMIVSRKHKTLKGKEFVKFNVTKYAEPR